MAKKANSDIEKNIPRKANNNKMLLKSIVDSRNQKSLAVKLRQKRFALFTALMSKVPRPLRILDVGGTEVFWEMMGFMRESDVEITLFNRSKIQVSYPNFTSIIGDARDMGQFGDNEIVGVDIRDSGHEADNFRSTYMFDFLWKHL